MATAGAAVGRTMRSVNAAPKEVSLYAKRETIYQKEVQGPWQNRRAVLLFVLAGFFLAVPWITWEGRQAVWLDVPARKFYLFELTLWPQDFIFLTGLLIISAFSLFFFTAVAGRLWCGYACPQTVWTKFFMWIEWLTEGDRNRRILLDRAPWSMEKVARKSAKHAGWLALCAVVGFTFVGYFIPIRDLIPRIFAFDVSTGETVFLAVASLLLYADAGFMREQVCKYACPYARFQGAMFDNNTLTIFYDAKRGEKRGSRGRTADRAALGLGDCIDCKVCVHVCPTGIDIRNGTQYECIGCAACIDACDEIMDEVGYPRGLVRYSTEAALSGKPLRLLRPKVVGYGAVLAAISVAWVVGLAQRIPLDLDVIRDRARLYREVSSGQIENVYTLKLMNKSQHPHTYTIAAEGDVPFALIGPAEVTVAPGELRDIPVQVRTSRAELSAASTEISFRVQATDNPKVTVLEESRFLAPSTVVKAGV